MPGCLLGAAGLLVFAARMSTGVRASAGVVFVKPQPVRPPVEPPGGPPEPATARNLRTVRAKRPPKDLRPSASPVRDA